MNRATKRTKEFAARLISLDARENELANSPYQAAFSICEKLRVHLVTMTGNAGTNALLSRALALAKADAPSLHGVRLTAEGRFEEIGEGQENVGREEAAIEGTVLLAHLIGLLMTFIGESLALRMLHEALPGSSTFDLDIGNREKK